MLETASVNICEGLPQLCAASSACCTTLCLGLYQLAPHAALLTIFFVFRSSTAIIKPAHVNFISSLSLPQACSRRLEAVFFFFMSHVAAAHWPQRSALIRKMVVHRLKIGDDVWKRDFLGIFFALSDIISDLHWMRARSTSFHTRGQPLSVLSAVSSVRYTVNKQD